MTSAATLAVPATEPHRASAWWSARWCRKAPTPAEDHDDDLGHQDGLPGRALGGPGERS